MAESKATFTVQDVESDSDVQEITDELDKRDDVMGADIDTSGEAEVLYDEDFLAEEEVKDVVRDAGYEVE